MSPNRWGPPIWSFFHTLAEKINPDRFHQVFPALFSFIFRICRVLPCPECSEHAVQFLSKINPAGVRNKEDFRNIMCFFHNAVNRRKSKSPFNPLNLTNIYGSKNVATEFNNFVSVFHTKGNMKLLAETFQRKLVLSDFRKWFVNNIQFFISPMRQPVIIVDDTTSQFTQVNSNAGSIETPNESIETPNESIEIPNKSIETPDESIETPDESIEIPNE